MSTDMDDLLARLRAATGADRDLDFAIFRIIRPEYAGPEWQPYGGGFRHVNDSSDTRCLPPADATPGRYTGSLDAALTLVPEGWGVLLHRYPDGSANASIYPSQDERYDPHGGATPALALCIAALEARRAGGGA